MRKVSSCLSSILLVVTPLFADVANASDQTKDEDRLKNCGSVLKEILAVPDNVPQDLLDKADCVVVFPSVVKAAFIVGGSYGRGAMSCRKGEDFRGPWGAPTMMALEGGSFGFQIGGQATDFVLLVMNESGARGILASKVKLGGRRFRGRRPGWPRRVSRYGCNTAFGNTELLKGAWLVCGSLA
jgi:lipid-binding SYLF domain-containing protein